MKKNMYTLQFLPILKNPRGCRSKGVSEWLVIGKVISNASQCVEMDTLLVEVEWTPFLVCVKLGTHVCVGHLDTSLLSEGGHSGLLV